MLRLSRRLDRLVGVLNETLGSADGARDIEAAVEVAQILGRFERLLERRFREAQGRAEPLELALIDLRRRHWSQMLTSARDRTHPHGASDPAVRGRIGPGGRRETAAA